MEENLSDEKVALKVQSGEIGLFRILVERYEKKIVRYARKFLFDAEEIKDVVQNVFVKTYTNINGFDAKRKFSSWIYRIAHNELVNALKRKNRNFLPLVSLDIFLPQKAALNELEQNIDRAQEAKMVSGCLDDLQDKYKEPLYLFYFEELDYKEISDIMQIPVSTVGVRIKRAKEIMRKNCENKINNGKPK